MHTARALTAVYLAALVLAGTAAASTEAASTVRPLSAMSEVLVLGEPVAPGPSQEAAATSVAQWAIQQGAIAHTFEPEEGVHWVLLPWDAKIDASFSEQGAVRVTVARRPTVDFDEAEREVLALAQSPGGRDYTFAVEIDAKRGLVAVMTDAPTSVTDPVAKELGGLIAFDKSRPIGLSAGARNADSAPHWGGASLSNPSYGGCSAGPTVLRGSTPHGTTAGHCGPNGTIWTSGGNTYGYTNSNGWSVGYDVGRIAATATSGTFTNRIYYGNMTTGSYVTQVGAGDPAAGVIVTSSSKWGSVQSTVLTANTNIVVNGKAIYSVFKTSQTNTNPGSSGGAVHTTSNGKAGVRGLISASSPDYMWASRWSVISTALDVSILT